MKFYPVPESKLDKVFPLIDKAYSELEMPPRASLEHAKRSVTAGYSNKMIAAYVDNLNAPKHLLVLSTAPGILFEGLITFVHLIYSIPEERGHEDVLSAMHLTIENYARFKRAGTIIGSSWVYGNSRPIDSMWKSRGYSRQENVYSKAL